MQGFPGAPNFLQQPPGVPGAAPAPQAAPAWQPPPVGAPVPSATPGFPPQAAPVPQQPVPGYSAPLPAAAPNPYAPPPAAPPAQPAYPPGVMPPGAPPGFQAPQAYPQQPVPQGYGAPAAPAMGMQMPWQGQMSNAQISEEGIKLGDGSYIVQIDNCIGKQTQVKGFCFIAEFTIVQSSNPAHPPGSKASYVQDFKIPATAWNRLMHFVAALLQKNIKDQAQLAEVRSVCEGVMNAAVAGHYNGRHVQVTSTRTMSKENRAYQKYNFAPAIAGAQGA